MQLQLGFDAQPLRLCVLGSGSAGNSVVLESGEHRLLIDAGFSCRQLEKRLAEVGSSPDGFRGIVLTHEHSDHTKGAERFARRHGVPVYATAGTLSAIDVGDAVTVRVRSGRPFRVGPFRIAPFAVPHDAREPIGVVVEAVCGGRVGLASDIGTASRLAWAHLVDLDCLILESNHDLEMLRKGPYPWALKQRVASRHGHLSNREAAEGVPELLSERLSAVVLYHLSRTNNEPALAAGAMAKVLRECGSRAAVYVTYQDRATPWIDIAVAATLEAVASERAV